MSIANGREGERTRRAFRASRTSLKVPSVAKTLARLEAIWAYGRQLKGNHRYGRTLRRIPSEPLGGSDLLDGSLT